MLAPSNVWLNFSSCIVSGASGVKVPPAIKGSPFFRYCGSRIVGRRSRRNVESVAQDETCHACFPVVFAYKNSSFRVRMITKPDQSENIFATPVDSLHRDRGYSSDGMTRRRSECNILVNGSTLVAATLLHINGRRQQAVRSTWTAYVVLQKSFDPGRRSSIEFHEMKLPLHASLRPFRKAPIGRIRRGARGTA